MTAEKKLYRSRNSLLGGVCTGIANYFNIDPIIVQILTVILTIATAGLLAVAYVALWIILPPTPDPNAPVDVQPHEVHSDTYGQVSYTCGQAKGQARGQAATGTSASGESSRPFVGNAHVPPDPPRSAGQTGSPTQSASYTQAHNISQPFVSAIPPQPQEPYHQGPLNSQEPYKPQEPAVNDSPLKEEPSSREKNTASGTASAESVAAETTQPFNEAVRGGQSANTSTPFSGQPQQAASAASSATSAGQPYDPRGVEQKGRASSPSGVMWLGFVLLFIGICALLGVFVTGVEWWQFWPLIFVIAGIGSMVVPGRKGHRMNHFVNGLMQFSFGAAALPFSLGIVSMSSLWPILQNLWPILIIMCGLFIIGEAMRAPLVTLLAGFCFVAFCVIALGWFAIPGPTDMFSVTIPTGREYVFMIDPWG